MSVMAFTILLFFIGFWILLKGAGVLVDGAVSFAGRLRVPSFLIGLVIVGIGTSIPEFAVAFLGNLFGENDISLGTIIGSNTFNILFVLGVSAVVAPLAFEQSWVARDLVWNALAVGAATAVALGNRGGFSGVTRGEGVVLLLLFVAWMAAAVRTADGADRDPRPSRLLTVPIASLLVLAGLAGVVLGGKWVVDGAVAIAASLGLSGAFIGLTLVGIGTSLPELAVSVAAAWRRQTGIAVGNIIGSNIFDFLMIVGASAVARPIPYPPALAPDIAVTLAATLLLFAAMFIGKRYILEGWQGLLFVVLYVLYFVYLVVRD